MSRMRRLLAHGFTLIEMVVVVVILAIVSVAVVTMVAQVGAGQDDNSDLQVGAQLVQECGEWIVSNHRRDENFFTSTLVTSASCFGLTTYGGFDAPQVAVSAYTGAGCPGTATCKLATITLTKSGSSLNPVNIVLVRYNPL
jgi:prepilin-type N-terminal cleavage/methylation domain-containing protein